jgi:hypothetical protein
MLQERRKEGKKDMKMHVQARYVLGIRETLVALVV